MTRKEEGFFSLPFHPTGSSIRGLPWDCSHLSFKCVYGIMSNGTFTLFSSLDYFGPHSSSPMPFYSNDIFFRMYFRQLWQSQMQTVEDWKWTEVWLREAEVLEMSQLWNNKTWMWFSCFEFDITDGLLIAFSGIFILEISLCAYLTCTVFCHILTVLPRSRFIILLLEEYGAASNRLNAPRVTVFPFNNDDNQKAKSLFSSRHTHISK